MLFGVVFGGEFAAIGVLSEGRVLRWGHPVSVVEGCVVPDCPGLEPVESAVATAWVDVKPRLAPKSEFEVDLLGEIRLIVREELQRAFDQPPGPVVQY